MELESRRFAVIGGAGLIGSHLVDRLLREPVAGIVVYDDLRRGTTGNLAAAMADDRVRFVRASMTDREELVRALAGVHGVFHLASLWLDECDTDPRAAWEVNVMGTWNVLEACRANGCGRIVYSSSASVYGEPESLPIDEGHPLNNRTTYGATKIACEQMLRATHAKWGLPYVALRYMNVYGPRMDRSGAYVSVIMRVLDRIAEGKDPIVHGDGTQTYDFVYAADAADANVAAMTSACSDEAFNIGTGIGTSISDLVSMLLELAGSSARITYDAAARTVVTRRVGTTEKAKRLLGFEARTALDDGLRQLVEWASARHGRPTRLA